MQRPNRVRNAVSRWPGEEARTRAEAQQEQERGSLVSDQEHLSRAATLMLSYSMHESRKQHNVH